MRMKFKSWQNARPGWTRRVIWFQDTRDDIRLQFEDADGKASRIYTRDWDSAQNDWDAFKAGNLSVAQILKGE